MTAIYLIVLTVHFAVVLFAGIPSVPLELQRSGWCGYGQPRLRSLRPSHGCHLAGHRTYRQQKVNLTL